MTVAFTVLGDPAAQGSKTPIVRNGRAIVVEGKGTAGRKKHRMWRTAVAEAAQLAAIEHGQLTGPTSLVLTLHFRRPPSRPKKHHGWHVVRPDSDKTLRACFDGLTDGGLIRDDNQICAFSVKAYETDGWTGATFVLSNLEPVRTAAA